MCTARSCVARRSRSLPPTSQWQSRLRRRCSTRRCRRGWRRLGRSTLRAACAALAAWRHACSRSLRWAAASACWCRRWKASRSWRATRASPRWSSFLAQHFGTRSCTPSGQSSISRQSGGGGGGSPVVATWVTMATAVAWAAMATAATTWALRAAAAAACGRLSGRRAADSPQQGRLLTVHFRWAADGTFTNPAVDGLFKQAVHGTATH
mmetsp:Transcript_38060/g.112714  ORF Transcript_38060/g.112714 Transcript_38060/m.112714 type:complete len:209 (-) Transcript_38060:593-1219(-)